MSARAISRIGVWNTAFLGDAVLTLPLLQTLRLEYPGAVLDYYVRGGLSPLFTAHPALNGVYEFEKNGKHKGLGAAWRFSRDIRARGYDIWISAHTSPRSGLMARASGAFVRIGYQEAWHSRLWYTHRVSRRFDELPETARLLQLCLPLEPSAVSFWPEIFLPRDAEARAEAFFSGLAAKRGGVHSPVIGLHPGSVWATKRWPARHFARIGAWAAREGMTVLLFAGKGEEGISAEVAGLMEAMEPCGSRDFLIDLSGRLPLADLAAYLGRLDCYVTNDSGPMHLAWAQGTPVIALFGPTVRRLGFFPQGEKARVFEHDLPCRPCGLHGHKACPLGHHNCLEQLLPEEVWPGILAALPQR